MIRANGKKHKILEFIAKFIPYKLAYWCHIRLSNEWGQNGISVEYVRIDKQGNPI